MEQTHVRQFISYSLLLHGSIFLETITPVVRKQDYEQSYKLICPAQFHKLNLLLSYFHIGVEPLDNSSFIIMILIFIKKKSHSESNSIIHVTYS